MSRIPAFIGSPLYQAGLTSHESFNKKADVIMTGNVYSSVQSSSYIRPRQQLECNGYVNAPGHLQNFDLKTVFRDPAYALARRYVETHPYFENKRAIAYCIRHFNGDTMVVHGVIITDDEGNLLRRFNREDLGIGRTGKSESVLDFCMKYLTLPKMLAA